MHQQSAKAEFYHATGSRQTPLNRYALPLYHLIEQIDAKKTMSNSVFEGPKLYVKQCYETTHQNGAFITRTS
jgi:hypothetical protein